MVALGITSGFISLFVFIYGWLFGVSVIFLRVIASLCVLVLLIFLRAKSTKLKAVINKLLRLRETTNRLDFIVISLICAFLTINLVGVFAPELGFDALWYHLTIPKIYLLQGKVDFIPGGLYYYSAMPKLTEIWYMISLAVDHSGTLAKLIHYSYGLGVCVLVYRIINRYINRSYGLIGVLGFISTLLVCWESGSAYIDLSWTFYTLLTVYLFLNYLHAKSIANILLVGVACGLAIGTKLPALFTVAILGVILISKNLRRGVYFFLTALLVSCPWFIFAYLKTGNPVYPMFTNIYPHENLLQEVGILDFLKTMWTNITWPQDPFSVFIGFIGIIFLIRFHRIIEINHWSNLSNWTNWLYLYFFTNYIAWYFFFRTSGSRFLLPLLPVWIILCLGLWERYGKQYYKILVSVLIFSSVINLAYRTLSISRVIPVITGKESRQEYLLARLNFNFGDFYDWDSKIKGMVGNETVLVYGFHNLFYADFNFTHESMVSDYNAYHYWLSDRPITNCETCNLLYSDPSTKVFLYSFPLFAKIEEDKPI